jgi:hypothetical protein
MLDVEPLKFRDFDRELLRLCSRSDRLMTASLPRRRPYIALLPPESQPKSLYCPYCRRRAMSGLSHALRQKNSTRSFCLTDLMRTRSGTLEGAQRLKIRQLQEPVSLLRSLATAVKIAAFWGGGVPVQGHGRANECRLPARTIFGIFSCWSTSRVPSGIGVC